MFKDWESAKSFFQPSWKSHANVFVSLIRWEQSFNYYKNFPISEEGIQFTGGWCWNKYAIKADS